MMDTKDRAKYGNIIHHVTYYHKMYFPFSPDFSKTCCGGKAGREKVVLCYARGEFQILGEVIF